MWCLHKMLTLSVVHFDRVSKLKHVLIDTGWCAHPCEPVLCSSVKMYTFVSCFITMTIPSCSTTSYQTTAFNVTHADFNKYGITKENSVNSVIFPKSYLYGVDLTLSNCAT